MHPEYKDQLKDDVQIRQPCPDVFWFPLMNPAFGWELIEETENFGVWSGGKHEVNPIVTSTFRLRMRQYGHIEVEMHISLSLFAGRANFWRIWERANWWHSHEPNRVWSSVVEYFRVIYISHRCQSLHGLLPRGKKPLLDNSFCPLTESMGNKKLGSGQVWMGICSVQKQSLLCQTKQRWMGKEKVRTLYCGHMFLKCGIEQFGTVPFFAVVTQERLVLVKFLFFAFGVLVCC